MPSLKPVRVCTPNTDRSWNAASVVALAGPGGYSGLVELATVEATPEAERHWMKAADARVPFVSVADDASWNAVAEVLERCGLSQVPMVKDGAIVGWVGDRELRRAVVEGHARQADER